MRLFVFMSVFLIASTIGLSFPQDDYLDDAYQQDTFRVNEMIRITKKIFFTNPDSASVLSDRIIKISSKINYNYGLFNGNNLKANTLFMADLNREAIRYFRKGFLYCDTINIPRGKAILLSNLGLSYQKILNMDSAIYYYDQAYNFSLRHNVTDIRDKVLHDLGLLYLDNSNYIMAYKILGPICDTFRRNNDTLRMILSYGSMGVLYAKLGIFDSSYVNYMRSVFLDSCYVDYDNRMNNYNNIGELFFREKNDYKMALYNYRKSLDHYQHLNDNYTRNSAYVNIGNVYYEWNMYDSAYYYYSLTENDTLTQYFPYHNAAILINIGEYFRIKKVTIDSRKYLEKGIAVAEENNLIEFLSVGHLSLSRLDSMEGLWHNSLVNFKMYKIYTDSLNQLTDRNEVSRLALENYISTQKYDNQLLIKENILNETMIRDQKLLLYVSLSALAVVILVLIVIFMNHRKIKRLLGELSNKHSALEELAAELKILNNDLDIERKNLNELNVTKDKFLSILSHDLKGPFHNLIGLLQIMDENWGSFSDEEKKENIHQLYDSSYKTHALLEDILTWGRSQQGKLESQPSVFNVLEQLHSVIELYTSQASKKEISILLKVPLDLTINNDPYYFKQIMQNLLNNAIKFSFRGGQITIEYLKEDGEMKFCIKDQGIGIPQNKLAEIFSITSTYRREGTEKEKSTGMGLILCKEYASIINAKLEASSTLNDPDNGILGGSVFCLTLPALPE